MQNQNPIISVIVPTFHRINGVKSAIESLLAQKNAPSFEIIIIDNDKDESARPHVLEYVAIAKDIGIDIIYDVEPASGVANARNRAITHAKGQLIAFLDDDEFAFDNWLAALYETQKNTNAYVVFGPIQARLLYGSDAPSEYFEDFFSRKDDWQEGIITKSYGCGNSMMDKEKVFSKPTPFNPATNETGGEDDLLFREVVANGGQFAWSQNAWVYEDVPRNRASYSYITPRAFSYGHNTTSQCFDKKHPNYIAGIISMLRGTLQAVCMAPIAIALWILRHKKRAWAYDKMLRGLGKVLWFGPFKQNFYGEAAKKYLSL
jgi:succinoglycan biosynthesis protein ExoM